MYEILLPLGKAISKNKRPIDSLIEPLAAFKYGEKDKQGNEVKGYVLKIVFDLIENCIQIKGNSESLSEYDPEKTCRNYLYAGNNGRRDKQYYLTRELKSSNYLFGKSLYDLSEKLETQYTEKELKENELYNVVQLIIKSELYNIDKQEIELLSIKDVKELLQEVKGTEKAHEFIKQSSIQIINKLNFPKDKNKKVVLITPKVKYEKNGEIVEVELVALPEYKELLERQFMSSSKNKEEDNSYCYLCKEYKGGVSSSFNLDFKVFTTTTINSASGIDKKNYDKNFKICPDCCQCLKHAEKYIKEHLRNNLGGVSTYIIPQSLSCFESISIQDLLLLSSKVELAFNEEKFKIFAKNIEYGLSIEESSKFALNFISYDTDGNYFKIVNQIHDVPELYFSEIINILAKNFIIFQKQISGKTGKVFHLGSIYQLVPIRYSKKGEMVEKKNILLDLYSQIFNKIPIDKQLLFKYFCSAIYQIRFEHQGIYKNLKKYNVFDFAIKDYFFRYLVLINTLKDLNLIKGENVMGEKGVSNEAEWEKFLVQNNFNTQQRALFYLGILINQVAYSQYRKGHIQKPILRKITYQGMSLKDIKRLYVDIFEKLMQYNAMYKEVEKVNSLCKYYFDKTNNKWELSDSENVFYLLSGYAYKVSDAVEELTSKNEDDININDNNNGEEQ